MQIVETEPAENDLPPRPIGGESTEAVFYVTVYIKDLKNSINSYLGSVDESIRLNKIADGILE